MADLQKRASHTPRRVREQRVMRFGVVGGVAGAVFVVALILAIVGVIGAALPVAAIVVAVVCAYLFRREIAG